MLALVWKLAKLWGGHIAEFLYKLLKAQVRAILWKYGFMVVMMVVTLFLAFIVLK